MKKDIKTKIALTPMPVLMIATYDKKGKVDVMNAAWGMISAMDKITLFIEENHKTTKNIRDLKAFTVSIADKEHMAVADFFGIVSGNKMKDKFERSGCHAEKSKHVNAPVIEEFPVVMECELLEIVETENLHAIVGKIVNAQADEKVLTRKGVVSTTKFKALAFNQLQNTYHTLGRKVGKAWHEGAVINFDATEMDEGLHTHVQEEINHYES